MNPTLSLCISLFWWQGTDTQVGRCSRCVWWGRRTDYKYEFDDKGNKNSYTSWSLLLRLILFLSHSCHPAIPFANSWSIIGPFSFSSLFKFCFFHCLTAKYVSFCEFCDPHHHMYPYRNHHSPLLANPSTSRHKVQSRSSISLTNQWDLWELSALSALSLVGQWLTYVWHLWFGYPC